MVEPSPAPDDKISPHIDPLWLGAMHSYGQRISQLFFQQVQLKAEVAWASLLKRVFLLNSPLLTVSRSLLSSVRLLSSSAPSSRATESFSIRNIAKIVSKRLSIIKAKIPKQYTTKERTDYRLREPSEARSVCWSTTLVRNQIYWQLSDICEGIQGPHRINLTDPDHQPFSLVPPSVQHLWFWGKRLNG